MSLTDDFEIMLQPFATRQNIVYLYFIIKIAPSFRSTDAFKKLFHSKNIITVIIDHKGVTLVLVQKHIYSEIIYLLFWTMIVLSDEYLSLVFSLPVTLWSK